MLYQYIYVVLIHKCCIDTYMLYWYIYVVSIHICCIDTYMLYWYIYVVSIHICCIDTYMLYRYSSLFKCWMLRRQTHHWGPPLGSRQACSPHTPGHRPPETHRISPCLSETHRISPCLSAVRHKECQINNIRNAVRHHYLEYLTTINPKKLSDNKQNFTTWSSVLHWNCQTFSF